ncbi:unnamed protein product [Discula destructiva]
MTKDVLNLRLERQEGEQEIESTPDHHILPSAGGWTSYLPNIFNEPAPGKRVPAFKKRNSRRDTSNITGFQNPWPSFHKATPQEVLQSLEFGADGDPAIELAASHLPTSSSGDSIRQKSAQLLQSETPDFSFDVQSGQRAKTTWLGHAGMLLQLPALKPGGVPIRIIFDPIFSQRASPSQYAGPIRSYDPPCKLEELPPIDLLLLSHNHFDHLDYATVMALWRLNNEHMRFLVPLKNAQWFVDAGVPADRVTELDWWESAYLTEQGAAGGGQLKVSCTPAQHSSVRDGYNADSALWSGWYLQHQTPKDKPYRVFFAGDSGYQYHDSTWPPQAPKSTTHKDLEEGSVDKVADPDKTSQDKYPACPAYREIAERFGTPDLVYLPIALGATWAYLRSFFSNYMPPSTVPFPRHSAGVAGAFHMPPWDAVRVLRDLTEWRDKGARPPVCLALHWGTFVTEPIEILKTLGLLEWACYNQGVRFGRELHEGDMVGGAKPPFLALNHGQSVVT